MRASRSLHSRTKPKISLPIHLKGGGCRGEPQKNERKFYGFVFVASLLQKGLINNIAQVQHTALSSVACAERGASSPSLVVALIVRSRISSPPYSPFTSYRSFIWLLRRFRVFALWLRLSVVVIQKSGLCQTIEWHKQIILSFPYRNCTPCRHFISLCS